jgi:hypothetical protein
MNRITAGGSLTIEIQPTRWRLVNNATEDEAALVEANYGEPLRYLASFATTRRLPDTGLLPSIYVQRVVLGWSVEDEAWHLGFLLDSELAQPRGSRWCEIVHWPDPDGALFANSARTAGESLAGVMSRPFYFVPPRPVETAPPPEPLPALPGKIDTWTVGTTPNGQIEATMAQESSRSRLGRSLWYLLLSVIYIALSILTLISGIALPRPEFLPFLGLAAAVLLLGISIRTLLVRDAKIDRILVHPEAQAIRGLLDKRDRWRYESDELQAVYISTVAARKPKGGRQAVEYGELNLQRRDGSFHFVLSQSPMEIELVDDAIAFDEGVRQLTPGTARTALQALALHVATMLNVPCYSDVRWK